MPDQNQTNTPQDPTTVVPPVVTTEPTPTEPSTAPSIFPQSDLPPLPPEFQNVGQTTETTAPTVTDSGSAAPPDISSVISKPKKKFGGGRIIATILGLVVLVGGIGAGIVLTQQQQLLEQKAGGSCTCESIVPGDAIMRSGTCSGTRCICPSSDYEVASNNCTATTSTGGTTGGGTTSTGGSSCPISKSCSNGCKTWSPSTTCSGVCIECIATTTCPSTDCSIPSTTSGAVSCTRSNGQSTYCCPTSSPLYDTTTKTCGSGGGGTNTNCPSTDCSIPATTSGAVSCTRSNGQSTYCCPTSSPLYDTTTKTCGGGGTSSACVGGTLSTYGTGYKGALRAEDVSKCSNGSSLNFTCSADQYATLIRNTDCSCKASCAAPPAGLQSGQLGQPGNCAVYQGGAGRCYVTTNIGVAPDGTICNGAHWTTCAAGTTCKVPSCTPGNCTSNDCVPTTSASTPPSTESNPSAPSCVAVKAYNSSWTELTGTQLAAVKAGTALNFCVASSAPSGTFDKAQFKINAAVSPETTTKRPSSEDYCQSYTVAAGDTSVSVLAKIHHSVSGWVGESF